MEMDTTTNELQEDGAGYQSFTELKAWLAARKLKVLVRGMIRSFPSSEKFRLADQLTRSSRSVGGNIAEGHGRRSPKDELHFCIQARGSLSETLNHMTDALDENYISQDQFHVFKTEFQQAESLLNGYIKYLRLKTQN